MSVATAPIGASTLAANDLGELMQSFNSVTEQLMATHGALQSQVGALKRELAEANARIRRTEALAALGEMAAGIAHEVRNPLGSIRLYAQVLHDEVGDRAEPKRLCERIDAAAIRLDLVVREVLAFARHKEMRSRSLAPEELVDRSIGCCEALVVEHDVEVVRLEPEERLAELDVDCGLLSTALGNLVRNAIEAMIEADSPVRRIAVRMRRARRRRAGGETSGFVVISFEDTGPGVPEESIPRLFNPFFTTRADGTGLGLSIVHRVVDAHGGHIEVGRSDLGGARFDVFLPEDGPAQDGAETDADSTVDGAAWRDEREACR